MAENHSQTLEIYLALIILLNIVFDTVMLDY